MFSDTQLEQLMVVSQVLNIWHRWETGVAESSKYEMKLQFSSSRQTWRQSSRVRTWDTTLIRLFPTLWHCTPSLEQFTRESPTRTNCPSLEPSMTTLMKHSSAQPRECSFLPIKLMSKNYFFIGLCLGLRMIQQKRDSFLENEVFQKWIHQITAIMKKFLLIQYSK